MESADRPPPGPPLRDFGLADWLVEPRLNRISRNGADLHLRPQLMDLLVFLAGHQGAVVSKDQILDAVWPQQYIAESGLARCIAELRVALGDDAKDPRCIQTIHKRGYRLIAEVRDVEPERPTRHSPIAVPVPLAEREQAASESAGSGGDAGAADGPARVAPPASASLPDAESPMVATSGTLSATARAPRPRLLRWVAISVLPVAALIALFVSLWSSRTTPALGGQDTVLLADVVNRTGDTVFDGTLKLALAVQLEQSPFLRLVADDQVRAMLRLMARAPDTALVGGVARETCERAGAKALIAGSIAPLGGHYAIGIEAVACRTGETLARELAEAESKDHVLDALGRAASRLRVKLGEALPSVAQYDVPIAQATTASLEALTAFSRGELARESAASPADWQQVMTWYDEAIRNDPGFAMAHARQGTVLRYLGKSDEANAAYQRAYDLRERVTDPERYYIESHYYFNIAGDIDRGNQVLEVWKRTYAGAYIPRYNLAFDHFANGRIDRGLEEAREAHAIDPREGGAIGMVVSGLLARGQIDQAWNVLNDAVARGIDSPSVALDLLRLAKVRRDQEGVARARRLLDRTPQNRIAADLLLASSEMALGRRALGKAAYAAARERARLDDQPGLAHQVDLWEAFDEALLGYPDEAQRLLGAVPFGTLDRGTQALVAHVMVRAGATDAARQLVDALEASRPAARGPRSITEDVVIPMTRALLAAETGHLDAALREAHALSRFELWPEAENEPVLARADIHLAAGQFAEAEAAFRKVIAHGGSSLTSLVLPAARLGLARSLALNGRTDAAREAYDDFMRAWTDADPEVPLIEAARRERAALDRR